MKLTTLFIFALCLHASARINGQQVTLQASNQKLEQVFRQIKAQTGYVFIYNDKDLAKARPVSVDLRDLSITAALDKLLQGQQLTYEIKGNTIFVSAKEEKLPPQTAGGISQPAIAPAPPVVHGRVTDEKGEPVVGVSISIKGGKIIGVTDGNGEFKLNNVADNAILIFSGVAIETVELSIKGRPELALKVKSKISELEEVIVNKGYYNERQKFSASNVGRVSAKEIEKQPVSSPLLALQGRVPGLLITQSSGVPNSGVNVQIQGQNSIFQSNSPFYVVDGVPFSSQLLPTFLGGILGGNGSGGYGDPLSFINPLDIEAIEVLKDADATAIYGSRAANGAILITTKKGKVGQTRVNASFQTGWGKVTRTIELLNTPQYREMRFEALKNDGIDRNTLSLTSSSYYDLTFWDSTRNTNWQKELIGGTAKYDNAQVSVSGGNSNNSFLIGMGYNRQSTVFPGNFADKKVSVHFNLNHLSSNQRLRLTFSGSLLDDDNRLPSIDLTLTALRMPPNAPALYNSDGSLNWFPFANGNSGWLNPLSYTLKKYGNKSQSLVSAFLFNYSFSKDFSFQTNVGYRRLSSNELTTNPLIAVAKTWRLCISPTI